MPVEISGQLYSTVAERLKQAHGDQPPPVGIQAIHSEVFAVGDLVIVKATVVFGDGRNFVGHSLVNMDARGRAERDAPLETCETSAVGRALAMAGYPGSDKGIAGAEEITLAQQRANRVVHAGGASPASHTREAPQARSQTARPMPSSPSDYGATPAQVRYLNQLWEQAGRPFPPPDTTTMDRRAVSGIIDDLKAELGVPQGKSMDSLMRPERG